MSAKLLLYIAVGGALGAVGRYLSTVLIGHLLNSGLPYGTMVVKEDCIDKYTTNCNFLLEASQVQKSLNDKRIFKNDLKSTSIVNNQENKIVRIKTK